MSEAATVSEEVVIAQARGAIYRLLSQGLSYPDADGLSELLETDLPLACHMVGALDEDLALPLVAFGHRVAHSDAEAIALDFERIFTHVHSVDCPPYETSYISKGLFQQTNDLADIAAFYAAYGMSLSDEAHERHDHITVECEFMHVLAIKQSYALEHDSPEHSEGCWQDQRRFFEEHLGRWGPEFARRLLRLAAGSPYVDLAELASAFLAKEAERLVVEPLQSREVVAFPQLDEMSCGDDCLISPTRAQDVGTQSG